MLLAAATRVLCCTVTAVPGTKATTWVEKRLRAMGEMEIKGSYFCDFGRRRCLAHPQALEGRVLDASAAHSSLVMFFSPLWATRARVGALGVRWCALVYVLSASCFLGLRSFCSLATSRTHLTHSCINSLTRSTVGASLTRSQSVSAALAPSPASHAGRVCMYVCVHVHSRFLSFFVFYITPNGRSAALPHSLRVCFLPFIHSHRTRMAPPRGRSFSSVVTRTN